MFEALNEALPDKAQYLKRLGLSGDLKPDLRTLDRLILAQLQNVPFENLDVFDAGTEISLEIPQLFDKIVRRRRGGYCFELNALFMALLKELGFECYPVMVRVVWMSTGYMPITHRADIVTIDKVRYFVDVGFGGPAPNRALVLDELQPQACGNQRFVFDRAPDGDYVIYRVTENEREQLLKFDDRPCENVDFLGPNEYLSHNRDSGFKKTRMLNIGTPDGSVALTNNVLRVHRGGAVEECVLDSAQDLKNAVQTHFGIAVDFPLKTSY